MSHKLTKNIPLLRFPEFSGEWEIKNLSDIATKQTKKNDDNSISRVLTNSATKGIIDQQDYFDKDIANADNLTGYYVIDKGDYVYNPRISANAPVGPINKNKIGLGVMSPLYTVFRFNNQENTFYEQYFKTSFWHKYMCSIANYGARHDRMNITTSDFMNLPLPFPSLQEQEKIANFLTTIDKKITLLRQKLELLQTYKRGVMQQIFSQEIRFKNDDGSNFPDWEIKSLGDVLKSVVREVQKPSENYLAIGIRSHMKGTFQKPDSDPNKIEMEKLYVVHEKDLIVNITFAWEGAIAIVPKEDHGGLVSHRFPTYIAILNRS